MKETHLETTMRQLGDLFEEAFRGVTAHTTGQRDNKGRPLMRFDVTWASDASYERAKAAFSERGIDIDALAAGEIRRGVLAHQSELEQRSANRLQRTPQA